MSPTTEEINLAPGSVICEAVHALHAEEQQTTKKERAKAKTDKELQLALVQAVSKPRGFSAPRYQQTKGGRGKGWGGRPSSLTERNPEQWGCVICGTDDHLTRECSKCRLCKKDGHWARECPENQQNHEAD
ncbi:Cold shock protein 1 [Labeo rohita]|uniref:Cold shock protein 1 n=1 Tax=Labeo rohita TaxID=84645 RepID=A0ABQ8L072_LABRO|nr:Cold shock protein 1 [Labeo rohita]